MRKRQVELNNIYSKKNYDQSSECKEGNEKYLWHQIEKSNKINKDLLHLKTLDDNDSKTDHTNYNQIQMKKIYNSQEHQNFIIQEKYEKKIQNIEKELDRVKRIQQKINDFGRQFSSETKETFSESFVNMSLIQNPVEKQILDHQKKQYEMSNYHSQIQQGSTSKKNKCDQENKKESQKFNFPNLTSQESNQSGIQYFKDISQKNSEVFDDGNSSDQGQCNKDQDIQIQSREEDFKIEEVESNQHQRVQQGSKSTEKNHHIWSNYDNLKSSKNKSVIIPKMTILYSEPLVKQSQEGMKDAQPRLVSAGDPVDYELEIKNLQKILEETKKEINLVIDVANLDNLEKAFTNGTEILHIMCHGDLQKDLEYYLGFEDEESKLDQVTSSRFQEFLKNRFSNVKVLFLNSCHSEQIGKIFSESGIPFVIAVQSDSKIEEKAALTFSTSFYRNLFSGISLQESFNIAQGFLKSKQHENCFTCCCAHSHNKNCKWQRLYKILIKV